LYFVSVFDPFSLVATSVPSYTPSAMELDVTTENTSFFYVTQDIGCGESSGTPVEVGVFLVSPRPLVFTTSYDICVGAASPTLFALGFDLKWYSDINLTNQIGSGLTFTPGAGDLDNTVQATTSFYVSQDIGCGESLPVKVDVSVIVPSPPPVADTPVELCLSDAIPTLTASGSSLLWYTDGTLGTSVGSGATYTPTAAELDVNSEGTTLFFVTQNQGCGEGPADTVEVSVNTSSPAPIVTDPFFTCQNSGAPTISATGTNLLWYTDETLTNLVWAGNDYTPTPIDFDPSQLDTTTFFVTQEIGCGQSPGAPVRVVVQTDASQAPEGDTLVIACLNTGQPTLSVQGNGVEWYADPGLINLVGTGNQFTPDTTLLDVTVEDFTSFYAIQNTACGSSPVLEVVVNVFDCNNCFDVTVDTSPSQCTDDNGTIELTRSLVNGGAIYLLSDGVNTISQDNGRFMGLASGDYSWQIIDDQGCSENGTAEISFIPPVVNLTVDNVIDEGCIGLGGSVEVTILGGADPYQWSSDRGITWNTFSNGLIERFPSGTNTLFVRNDSLDVCVDSASITIAPGTSNLAAEIGAITLSVPDLPTGSLIVQNIRGGIEPYETRLDLTVPIDPDQSLSRDWSAAQFDPTNNWFEQNYTQIFAGEYEVGVRDDSGCEITLTAMVDFDPNLFIPTVFTPNNDGFNDTFFVRNLPASGSLLVVSNRWGRVVFESSDYRNDWDGEGVSEGIYYYSFVIDGSKYSGTVELWRGRN